jgi:SAM-dependent methyltransferase
MSAENHDPGPVDAAGDPYLRHVARLVGAGDHRSAVGGLWEDMGALQLAVLRDFGMGPTARLLDVGCGSLRLGVKAAAFLEPGHYFGTDYFEDLLELGYEREIRPAGLGPRLPRENLVVDRGFAFAGLPGRFDFAIAQSLFSHLPLNSCRSCFRSLAAKLRPGGRFLFTYFESAAEELHEGRDRGGGVVTFPDRDPYHYCWDDFVFCARNAPWELRRIGEWGHPRGQVLGLAERR